MESIYRTLLPEVIDNNYHGNQIVPVVFGVLNAVMTLRIFLHIVMAERGAQSVGNIPLDKYPKDAINALVLIIEFWGQSQLLISIVYWVVLLKYQSLLPFATLLFTFEWSMRLFSTLSRIMKKQVSTQVSPAKVGNYVMPVIGAILMKLSMVI